MMMETEDEDIMYLRFTKRRTALAHLLWNESVRFRTSLRRRRTGRPSERPTRGRDTTGVKRRRWCMTIIASSVLGPAAGVV